MPVLTTQQRNTLESAVKLARKLAETGARNALHALAVDNPEPFAHMTPEQRNLRNRLRSKARLLGDELPSTGHQQIEHLSYELAYENWHKMLFAKFLESNNLLMHTSGVAVTMEECEELAKEEGFIDKWDAAAAYASKMLPAIFRPEDPLMQIRFSSNDRIKMEEILDGLDNFIFIADDALGWVYQFWQSEAKAAINASGDKINGEKLPAVTQLFTEPYMVHFLIDNTLGAWWVSRHANETPPVKFEYLRLLDNGTPAAGKFEGWPNTTAAITSIDPCMGSGHFVASLFPVFASLRMYEEGLTKEEVTDKIIIENLHGLELDARCTQIAAFNLALTAWKFCGQYKELPEMNLACSGIAPKGKKEDWVKLVSKVSDPVMKARMENGMKVLYDHFQLAPELGSLLDPSTIKPDAFIASFSELQPTLIKALVNEADNDQLERGVMAAGIAKAGQLLARKYTLQITNVPYLGRGRQEENGVILNYCSKNYPLSKGDLANVFFEKMLKNTTGTACTVMPQNWLFLTTYKKHREDLLTSRSLNFIARLGAGAFSQITGEVVKAILIAISPSKPRSNHLFIGLDVSEASSVVNKDSGLKDSEIKSANQFSQLKNPDARVVIGEESENEILEKISKGVVGIQTGDFPQFGRYFWELIKNSDWEYESTTLKDTAYFGGKHFLIYWQNFEGVLAERQKTGESYVRGWAAFGNRGILVSATGKLQVSLYNGELFDNNCAVILPDNLENLPAIWCFCSSSQYNLEVRKVDQALKVTNATLVKVPFDLSYWQTVAKEKYPNGLPKPYSDDPVQWLFHGNPIKAEYPSQVSIARLLGYRWPSESDTKMELADEAKALIKQIKEFDALTDEDGILCLPPVNGELAASERLRSYLQKVYGSEWNNTSINQLLAKEGSKKSNLEDWLREEFFEHHCKLFQNRPFIWHISDGKKDGFSALVNYHKLNKENLQRLIFTYLGDWIRQCEAKRKSGESGAEGLLSAALKLKEKLEAVLEGEAPYDIFVRWKPLSQQPIGWEPDLNDGVRLNIRPFITADVLRKKPNIKWGVDRGKNPPGSYWGEIRDNDKHLSLEEKKKSQGKISQTCYVMNQANIKNFVEQYEAFMPSDTYKERDEQKAIVPVFRAIIRELLKNEKLSNQHMTDLIQIFKFNCSNENFDNKLAALIKDPVIRNKLSEQAYEIGEPGFTNAGKTGVSGLTPKQLSVVRQFLLDAFSVKTKQEAIALCRSFDTKDIPQIKKGIYSPWLYYINPAIFPIVNNSHQNFKKWLGLSDSYPDSIEEYHQLNDLIKETDFGGLDYFAHHLSKDGKLNLSRVHYLNNTKLFKISHGVFLKRPDFAKSGFIKILEENNWISLSRYTGKGAGEAFESELRIGDLVYLCYGGDKVISVAKVISDAKPYNEEHASLLKDDEEEWIYREVEPLYFPIDNNIADLKSYRSQTMPSGNSTFWEVKPNDLEYLNDHLFIPKFNLEILKTREDDAESDDNSEDFPDKNSTTMTNNSILFGPPGTGKTFHSISHSVAVVEKKSIESIQAENRMEVKNRFDQYVKEVQIVFCTFHQSLGYEDFIEGIKPVEPGSEEEDLTYAVEDGIFKRLCTEAAFSFVQTNTTIETGKVLDFSAEYDRFVDMVNERFSNGETTELTTRSGGNVLIDSISQRNNIIVRHSEGNRKYTVSKKRLSKISQAFPELNQVTNINDQFRAEIGGSNSSAYWAVLNAIRIQPPANMPTEVKNISGKEFSYDDKKEIIASLQNDSYKNGNPKNFVLIIDEINRGNVSQIFGELITLIEDDKRLGREEALRVTLPYSKESFGVPCNISIIGTMNTADRSVEALDTALRRRFSFVLMTPKPEELKITTDGINLPDILRVLNRRLAVLKDIDHTIGHAWLWNVSDLNSLKVVFRDKILPLLQEYFYNDYEKLGLVLGDAFFKKHEPINSNIFAAFTGGNGLAGQYDQTWQYQLKDTNELTIHDFKSLEKLNNVSATDEE